VRFLDTTLRDGEQTPGVSLTPAKKLNIARQLDLLGVEVIEAGFAAVSEGEARGVKLIASEGLEAEICSATRGVMRDIDIAIDCGVDSVNIIVPVSDLHIEQKLGKSREEVLVMMEKAISHAKDHGLIAELSAEDGSRTDMPSLKEVIRRAIDVNVDRIAPCDTVGILTPEKTRSWFGELRQEFPDVVFSVHCHDDFGLAVANSVAALSVGVDQVHGTINGVGERAGNASLEEIAVALKVLYDVDTNVKTELLYETSQLVSRLMGILVQPNKAIVGANAFAHESGIHTHAILRNPLTYEAIRPELVGAARSIVSGKHAGSAGVSSSLGKLGLEPSDDEFKEIYKRVKERGDKGESVTDADLLSIAWEVMGISQEPPLNLDEFIVVTGNKITSTASVKLRLNGDMFMEAATGNGPVDATLNAVNKAIHPSQRATLDRYGVEAITGGTDAVVNVSIRLRRNGRLVTSKGVNEDIVMASVNAYLKGMNVLLVQEEHPEKRWSLKKKGNE
jgi:D-citramalate synthase